MRIVSLISSATEMLYLLGLGECVVGVSHECDFPTDAAGKPRLTFSRVDSAATSGAIDVQVRTLMASGSSLYELDVELLASLAPDLVITQAQCDVCAIRHADVVAAVRSLPILRDTQILSLNPKSIDDVLADLGRIGEATDCQRAAHAAIAGLQQRIDAVRGRCASLGESQRPRVACIEWIEPLMLAGNWTPQLVAWAGGISGLATAGEHSVYSAWSELVAFDPEVLVVMPCGFDLARSLVEAEVLRTRPGWSGLSAVRNSRSFVVDGNAYFNRSGPRLVDSLEILAALVHPDLFGETLRFDPAPWRAFA